MAELPSVTQILRALGIEPSVRGGGGVGAIDWPAVFARGRAVHRACELEDKGTLDPASVHPVVAPYLDAWRAFKRDTGSRTALLWEQRLTHHDYGFRGRLDTVRLIHSQLNLVDLKSGSDSLATVYQCALYRVLVTHQRPPICPPPRMAAALVLRADATYRFKQYTLAELDAATSDALAAVRVYHLLARLGRLQPDEEHIP